jgi:DinB superfamily
MDWTGQLTDQLERHWNTQLRPRLDGLTEDEYFWEPVDGCWTVRPAPGGGATIDFAYPPPDPAPVTTIAWRLAHVTVGVFGLRAATHFGGPPAAFDSWPYACTATEALAQLDATYDSWITGVRGLHDAALARPVGPAEGAFAELPMAALVLHIHREAIHHGAEICLLRDLYRARR